MPHKNNSTPIKPSEGSTMTHEDEELQDDLSKVQEKVHQISLSQRATKNQMEFLKKGVEAKMDGLNNNMDGLKKCVEAKLDGMEVGMEANMDEMEAKIDEKMKDNMENMKNYLKVDIEGLAKLIQ